ncbi:DUF1573 domain-containing protein [Winogradskyella sp. UBA3174]|uniref:DUF1573 domain-containing protein n=1 Tax=Winogradskyella sp. UBA3174 TaxID=1947785 RepID=UPI0025FFDE70|nr:DUF1573 domain-containing protein [Winogradskyella sp. UBA3174]|tara:strand:- start:18942 stop:19349 length:408 start_codon:yes stop_codon:yes gene_type:complete
MKRTFNIAILLVLALSFFNAAPTEFDKYDSKVAIIKFKTEIINYGTIAQNSDGTRIFTFTNTGEAPLLITKVITSCGCTVPSYSKAPIQPGATGELEIKYNTKKLGAFTKTITVTSNAEGGHKILKIKGNIVASK